MAKENSNLVVAPTTSAKEENTRRAQNCSAVVMFILVSGGMVKVLAKAATSSLTVAFTKDRYGAVRHTDLGS